MLLLIGSDDALLEGLVQMLAGGGIRVRVARSVTEGADFAMEEAPLVLVVDRECMVPDDGHRVSRIPLAPGGALIVYQTVQATEAVATLPHRIARYTLADLALPLERQRLLALVQHVAMRARESGRRPDTLPVERRAPRQHG